MNNLRHSLNTFWKRGDLIGLSPSHSGSCGSPAEQTAPQETNSIMCICRGAMIQKLLGTHSDLWPQVTHVEIQLNPIKACAGVGACIGFC